MKIRTETTRRVIRAAQFDLQALEGRQLYSVAPAAPSALVATGVALTSSSTFVGPTATSSMMVNLSWQDNSTNETGFMVARGIDGVNFSNYAALGANTATFNDASLRAGYTFYYRVYAMNGPDYSEASNTASFAVPAAPLPAAPASLTVNLGTSTVTTTGKNKHRTTSTTTNSATVVWDASPYAERYVLQRQMDGGQWIIWDVNTGVNNTSYSDPAISAGHTYTYRVMATNATGESAWTYSATLNA